MPPRKKPDATNPADPNAKSARAAIVLKDRTGWDSLVKQVRADHWRTLRIEIQIRDAIWAGKPKSLDAAKAMLKARDLEDQIEAVPIDNPEARAEAGQQAIDEGLCEFHRRDGKPGCWYPTNHIKAMLKENWSVLGFRVEHRGSRGALAEGCFVHSVIAAGEPEAEHDWLYLGPEPDDIQTVVTHTDGPRGRISAIKRHEIILQPRLKFDIVIANAIADKLPDDAWARTFVHACEHGLGACRSQGHGRFDLISIEDMGLSATAPAAALQAV